MARSIGYTQIPWNEPYSEIVDVRSPSEFAEDHIPGATNLPVLNDPERAEVGTLYKQVDPFTARKVGAALVSGNISKHLADRFRWKDKDYHPLVYCWRGGQRSHSLAAVLSEIGWQVTVVKGGYKTYRAYVRDRLETLPHQLKFRVLCGSTGTGKTRILHQIQQRGGQVLDLEALANHRGSLLGQEWEDGPSPQPSQKYFESLLLQQLQTFDPRVPIWVESESNKIGRVYLPRDLWDRMKQATGVEIEVPMSDRIEWLMQQYPHLIANPDLLTGQLRRLKSRYGGKKIGEWESLIAAGKWEALVGELLACHYDPTYRRSLERCYPNIKQVIPVPDLSDVSINTLIIESLLPDSSSMLT